MNLHHGWGWVELVRFCSLHMVSTGVAHLGLTPTARMWFLAVSSPPRSSSSFLTVWWLGSTSDHTKKQEMKDEVFQGLGPDTGTASLLPWAAEREVPEPKFKRKGHKPHLLREEW